MSIHAYLEVFSELPDDRSPVRVGCIQVTTAFPIYITASTLSRYSGLDRRTVTLRLTRAGFDCHALVDRPGGDIALWKREHLSTLLKALERQGPLPICAEIPHELSEHE